MLREGLSQEGLDELDGFLDAEEAEPLTPMELAAIGGGEAVIG